MEDVVEAGHGSRYTHGSPCSVGQAPETADHGKLFGAQVATDHGTLGRCSS